MNRKRLLFPLKYLIILLGSIFSLPTLHSLNPDEGCLLLDHMVEVNKQWLIQEVSLADLNAIYSFEQDDDRIQSHLKLVEQILRKRPTDHLNARQKQKRLATLDILQQYWKRKLFPRNHFHPERQPYFVDNYGTACAVGYLVLETGGNKLVEQIKATHNYAYLAELAELYPQLRTWATDFGFTLDELAWIQPAYPPEPRPFQAMGNGEGVEGTVNAMITSEDGEMLYLAGEFSVVDGVEASSIIAWNGDEWLALGEGLEGVVYALEWHEGRLYAAGNFTLPNDPETSNVAYWDGNNWTGLQTGDMEGSIYAIRYYFGRIYIGGDFQKVDNNPMPHLAFYELTTSQRWKNSVRVYQNGQFVDVPGATEVNAPVRCLERVWSKLLVGGDFTLTAPNFEGEDVDQLDANYLAYWDGINWIGALYGSHSEVYAAKYIDGDLYIGGNVSEGNGFSILRAGLWIDQGDELYLFPNGDNLIHQFIEHENGALMVGGFDFEPGGISIYGIGAAIFDKVFYDGVEYLTFAGFAIFDNTVKAVARYKGQLVFAGDFEQINLLEVKNLAVLDVSTPSFEPDFKANPVEVYSNGGELIIRYDNLEAEAYFALYNLQGQQIRQFKLAKGAAQIQEIIDQLPRGAYVYQIANNQFNQSGKIIR